MLDCNNINLKLGSTGGQVLELQKILANLGYYSEKQDGVFGNYTKTAVINFQKKNNLLTDAVVGAVTCKRLNSITPQPAVKKGIYESVGHWVSKGCNKLGQCNSSCCGPHSIRQGNAKRGIDEFLEAKISSWAGTTSRGTSHAGIETALAMISDAKGVKIKVEWKNYSDFGSTDEKRMEAIGKIMEDKNKVVILHILYKLKYGHYCLPKSINMNNKTAVMLNSLGTRCGGESFCGYLETVSWNRLINEIKGISQKSVLIVTYI